jgi:hypothetical protein
VGRPPPPVPVTPLQPCCAAENLTRGIEPSSAVDKQAHPEIAACFGGDAPLTEPAAFGERSIARTTTMRFECRPTSPARGFAVVITADGKSGMV